MELLAQFIPKSGGDLEFVEAWRAILVGSALQKWYVSYLLLWAELYLARLVSFTMRYRRGFQTAILLEPLRLALL